MSFYYYFLLFIVLFTVALLIRFFVLRKNNIPTDLFVEALRNENSGRFEAAVSTYESALVEIRKIRFHRNLKIKIIGKLKVLHTVMEYRNNLHYNRQNTW